MLDLVVLEQEIDSRLPSSGIQAEVLPQVCIDLFHSLPSCMAQVAS